MICPKCGAQISDGTRFCPKCAADISKYKNANSTLNRDSALFTGKNKGLIIIVCAIVAAVIFAAAAIAAFTMMSGKSPFGHDKEETETLTKAFKAAESKAEAETDKPAASAQPTAEPEKPTAEPVDPTPLIVYVPQNIEINENNNIYNNFEDRSDQPSQQEGGYKTYYSSKYNFACDYPASFSVFDDNGTLTLYTVHSPDGAGIEKIVAKPNEGETVDSSRREFINAHAGNITYEAVGKDYYAYSIRNGSMEFYRYCKFAKGNLYWFEFSYPYSQHEIYDIYINDVYNSFSY